MTTAADAAPHSLAAHVRAHRFPVSNYRPAVNSDIWSDRGLQLHLHVFHFPRFGDIDGDGRLELVYSKGCSEQVAYTLEGREIWRYHQPGLTTFHHAREDSLVPILDLDGDGGAEMGAFRLIDGRPHLCVLEAATGRVIRSRPYEPNPASIDTRMSLVPALLDGPGKPYSLVLTRDYWGFEVFTHELEPRWSAAMPEMGHTTVAADVDGDGRDELFTGTRLFRGDGSCAWAKPELLEGTGETHPDSMLAFDAGDGGGRLALAVATGAQTLGADGAVRWRRGDRIHHGQCVRLLRTAAGPRLVFADQVNHDRSRVEWRGRSVPDAASEYYVLDARGETVGRFEGIHTVQTGDWDGDGDDEVFCLARDRRHIRVHRADGTLLDELPVGERAFVSDMVVAPLLPGARGAQLVMHDWSDDETRTECVIFENTAAGDRTRPADALELARYSCY